MKRNNKSRIRRYANIDEKTHVKDKLSLTAEIYNLVDSSVVKPIANSPYMKKKSKETILSTPTVAAKVLYFSESPVKSNSIRTSSRSPGLPSFLGKYKGNEASPAISGLEFEKESISLNRVNKYAKLREGRQDFIISDLKSAIENLKKDDKNSQSVRDTKKKFMCIAVKNIVKQCEIANTAKETAEISNFIEKEQKVAKIYTEKINWTTQKLQELSQYDKPILKEIFDQDYYTLEREKADTAAYFKEFVNKSDYEKRIQAKLIKHALNKYKRRAQT